MERRGFTWVELLIVVGIVCVLLAITYPFYQRKLAGTHTAEAKQRLGRVYQAFALYTEAHDGGFPTTLEGLALDGTLPAATLLSPHDRFPEGFGTFQARRQGGLGSNRTLRNSLECFMGPDWARKDIRAVDPNHGIVADRTVGTYVDPNKGALMGDAYAYRGPYLRLRLDGTVQRRFLRVRENGFARHWLFTDEKLHGL